MGKSTQDGTASEFSKDKCVKKEWSFAYNDMF
jgi:hypothetical protein